MSSGSPVHMVPDTGVMSPLEHIPDLNEQFYSQVVMGTPGLSAHVQQMDTSDSGSDCTEEDGKVYTSLSDPKKHIYLQPLHALPAERAPSTENIDIRSWRERHPKHWKTQDIINWIYFVCSRSNKLDRYKIRGENFNRLRGDQLCEMSRDDFLSLEPNYGGDLYDCFEQLLKTAQFKAPEYLDLFPMDDVLPIHTPPVALGDHSAMWSSTIPPEEDQEMDLSACSTVTLNSGSNRLVDLDSTVGPGTGIALIGDKQYDYISTDEFEDIQTPHNCGESGYGSDGSTCNSPKEGAFPLPPPAHSNHPPVILGGPYGLPYHAQTPTAHMSPRPAHVQTHETHVYHHPHQTTTTPSAKPRGRPKRENPGTGTRGRKHGQTTKGNHLWEFIRDTINDIRYNPEYIKWENKDQGIFRIVNSAEIARMWGKTKNNSTMTYEKFSRAMRFCRTQSFFAELPKGGNYPKKLCFRFGTKATNWAQ